MSITRTSRIFIGTSESAGDTIANNATDTGVEQDILADDGRGGYAFFFAVFTSTVTAGTLDFNIILERITGQSYVDVPARTISIVPANATKKCFLCCTPVTRFGLVTVKNNATGANATNVFVGADVYIIA